MALSRVDSFEVIPQGDETNSENGTLGSGAFRDQPDDEDFKANPKPKLRNDTPATKRRSHGKILKPHEIEEFIKNIAADISNVSVDDFESCLECLDKLLDLYQFSVESQNQTGEWLNKYGVTEKLMILLEASQHFPDEDEDGQNIFLSTLTVCRNFTEASPAFSIELASQGIVAFLSTCLKHALISSETTSSEVLTLYICILHNIATHCGGDNALFIKARTFQALKEFASCEVDDIKLTSVLTMGYICTEKTIKRLQIQAEDIVTICVEWLKESIENKRTRRETCLQPWAIISGLTKLVVNDQMSLELNRTDLIQCVTDIINTSLNATDQTACNEFLTATKTKVSETKSTQTTVKKQKPETTPEGASTQRNSVQPETRTTNKHTDVKDFRQTREYDLLLLGKTGNGKSAVGNTIIGRNEFKSCSSSTSVTKEVTFEIVKFEDCDIKIVDGPGMADTDGIEDIEKATEVIVNKMQHAVTLSPAGYHAFLLVVKFGNRFTAEDHACIKVLKNIFGEDFVRHYCILLMTCGDIFKQETGNMQFREWCEQQDGVLKILLTECNGKVVLFDNKSKDERVRHEQITELLRVIDSMQFAGQRYTDKHFQKVAFGREKLRLEAKEPMLSEAIVKKVSLIIQEFYEVHKANEEDQHEKLADLNERAQHVHRQTLELDNGTGVLKNSMEATKTLVKTIADRIHSLDKILAEKRRLIQKQIDLESEYKTKIYQQQELEKLSLKKKISEKSDLEKVENIRQKHDNQIKLITERGNNERRMLQNKRNKVDKKYNSSIEEIQLRLQDPCANTVTREELENEIDKLKTALAKKLSKIDSREKDLKETIEDGRNKARKDMEEEMGNWEREKECAQNLMDKNIAEIKRREEELTKKFENEKKKLKDDHLEAIQQIVAINNLKHDTEKALVFNMYARMKNAYQDSVKAVKNKDRSCTIS